MRRTHLVLAATFLVALAYPQRSVRGQAVYGSIVGTISDSSGGAVPNAKVVATEVEKGVTYTTTSNDSGNFSQTHLVPGSYRVRVEATGFQAYVQENVGVSADNVTQVNVSLQVGALTQTVEVKGEVALLKTEKADVATTFTKREFSDLPIFDRNFTRFQLLSPGTQMLGWQCNGAENPQGTRSVFVNGQHFGGVAYQLDGTDNRDLIYGNIVINPTFESIAEAKMTTQNYDAEFGEAQAAVFPVQTKSGTNELHGSAFEFRRNDLTQARDPFAQSQPIPGTNNQFIPDSLWNQFGGSLGGPIKKNKIFMFGDYQGTRRKLGGSVLTRVPTAAERNGDFSAWLNLPSPVLIYNPRDAAGNGVTPDNRQPFLGNIIPSGQVSPQAQTVLNKYVPLPDIAGVPAGEPNFSTGGREIFYDDTFNVRGDDYWSTKTHVFGRYTFFRSRQDAPGPFGEIGGGPNFATIGFAAKGTTRVQSLASGFDHTLRPTWLTDFRFAWLRERIFVFPGGQGTTPASDAGIPGLNFKDDPFTLSLPGFQITGQGGQTFGYTLNANQCNCPLREIMQQFQIVNNWTHAVGNHTVKFGADIRHLENLRVPSDRHRSGELIFDPTRTEGPNGAGLGLATYMLGDVTSFSRYVSTSSDAAERQFRWFFYGQDTWRATSKLTLNYGMRWEVYDPQTVSGPAKGGWLQLDTGEVWVAGAKGVGLNGNVKNNFTNFAPRLGLAYRLKPATVARAGYGRSFDVGVFGSIFAHSVTQNLPVLAIQSLTPANNYLSVFNLAVGPQALDPNTILDSQPLGPTGHPLLPDGVTSFAYPPKMRLATVDAWNATVQHELTPNMSIEASYVGNKGTHVFAGDGPDYNPNQPTVVGFPTVDTFHRQPFFNKFGWTQGLRYFGNDSNNNFNSFQTKVEKRFADGYSFIAHYTLARVRNYDGTYWPIDGRVNYGPTDWQRTHVFVLSHIYGLPFGKGRRFVGNPSRALDLLVGGWQLNGNWTVQSGRAFTPSYQDCGADRDTGPCRPDSVGSTSVANPSQHGWYESTGGQELAANGATIGPWRRPQVATFGDIGRNALRGPGWFTTDLSIFKNFPITERFRVQFRAESFNFWNHVNLGDPDPCVDCPPVVRFFRWLPTPQ
jgi:hypothetical protein